MKKRQILKAIKKYLHSPEAIIITGMHRIGKTTLLDCLFEHVDSNNKLFIRLENPINRRYFEVDNYEEIKSTFEFLGLDMTRSPYIFIDDIQFAKNLPSIVAYFNDNYRIKFVMACSGSFYLANRFDELLPGRKYIFELTPLDFKEFLQFKRVKLIIPDDSKKVTKTIFDIVMPYYREYLCFGGFPGIVLKKSTIEKKKGLEEIFSSFYQLVSIQLGDRRQNRVIRDLMLLLITRVGSRLDIQKMSRELNISRPTLYRYLTFLQSTYFISMIRPFNTRKSSEIKKMPKVYVCDTGLANILANINEQHLFENSIFQNLKNRGDVNYYYRKSGVKIDFILNRKHAYDVTINPTEVEHRKLDSLTAELACSDYKIISKNYSTLNNVIYGFML